MGDALRIDLIARAQDEATKELNRVAGAVRSLDGRLKHASKTAGAASTQMQSFWQRAERLDKMRSRFEMLRGLAMFTPMIGDLAEGLNDVARGLTAAGRAADESARVMAAFGKEIDSLLAKYTDNLPASMKAARKVMVLEAGLMAKESLLAFKNAAIAQSEGMTGIMATARDILIRDARKLTGEVDQLKSAVDAVRDEFDEATDGFTAVMNAAAALPTPKARTSGGRAATPRTTPTGPGAAMLADQRAEAKAREEAAAESAAAMADRLAEAHAAFVADMNAKSQLDELADGWRNIAGAATQAGQAMTDSTIPAFQSLGAVLPDVTGAWTEYSALQTAANDNNLSGAQLNLALAKAEQSKAKAIAGSAAAVGGAIASQMEDERARAALLAAIQLGLGFATIFTNPAEGAAHFLSAALLGAAAAGVGGGSSSGSRPSTPSSFGNSGGNGGGSGGNVTNVYNLNGIIDGQSAVRSMERANRSAAGTGYTSRRGT